jgi:hypothetical protein
MLEGERAFMNTGNDMDTGGFGGSVHLDSSSSTETMN